MNNLLTKSNLKQLKESINIINEFKNKITNKIQNNMTKMITSNTSRRNQLIDNQV